MPEMSAEARAYIEGILEPRERDALARYTEAGEALRRARAAINGVLIGEGFEPRFTDATLTNVSAQRTPLSGSGGAASPSERDAFGWKVYGLGTFVKYPMQTAIRTVLADRFAMTGGSAERALASIDDLYGAMKAGSFPFPSKDADKAKDGLRVSIGRRNEFTRVVGPNGPVYGLSEWYEVKSKRSTDGKESPDASD